MNASELNDQELIEVIDDDGEDLTTWEANFVESMMNRIYAGGILSPGQRKKATQIYCARVQA